MTQPAHTTQCECATAGYCPRHQCQKTEHWHKLCRTRPDYFELWEHGQGPGQRSREGPGLLRQAANFGKAVVRHIADQGRTVSDRVFRKRLSICQSCPACDVERWICREKTCGCRLEIKARWASEECPLGKWPQEIEDLSRESETDHQEPPP